MIDIKLLLSDFDSVRTALEKKCVSKEVLERLAGLARKYKAAKQSLEALQAEQNKLSKEYGGLMREHKGDANNPELVALKKKSDALKKEVLQGEKETDKLHDALFEVLLGVPNMPDSATPEGTDESQNIVLKVVGSPTCFSFTPRAHDELALLNGWIDFEAGVKLAKSRFSVLRGDIARLNAALINFMLANNLTAGFELCSVPIIVNDKSLYATGQLPKFGKDMFKIEGSGLDADEGETDEDNPQSIESKPRDLYLISTSEISLTNLYRDTIIDESDLPIRLTAATPCFRKEAGSAGRDTRGIIRQHQFDKCELVAITTPEQSAKMQSYMLQTAASILDKLELPYRFVQLCGGDLGVSAANTVDIEVWVPSQNCYREISSVSNCTDYQSRRGMIRYRQEAKTDGKGASKGKAKKGKNILCHTLNGSSLAVGRTLVAIIENYQNEDGSIRIPQALKPYML